MAGVLRSVLRMPCCRTMATKVNRFYKTVDVKPLVGWVVSWPVSLFFFFFFFH